MGRVAAELPVRVRHNRAFAGFFNWVCLTAALPVGSQSLPGHLVDWAGMPPPADLPTRSSSASPCSTDDPGKALPGTGLEKLTLPTSRVPAPTPAAPPALPKRARSCGRSHFWEAMQLDKMPYAASSLRMAFQRPSHLARQSAKRDHRLEIANGSQTRRRCIGRSCKNHRAGSRLDPMSQTRLQSCRTSTPQHDLTPPSAAYLFRQISDALNRCLWDWPRLGYEHPAPRLHLGRSTLRWQS